MIDTPPTTSATTIVPRMPLTAFGVWISTTSPGRIRDLTTATEMRPETRSIVDTPGTSVIVITERSRAVTIALPPSSIRANPLSPVVTRSFRRTSSLNFRGAGDVADGRGSAAPRPTVPPGQALCPTARARRAAPDPPLSTRPHSAIVSGHMPRLGLVPVLLLLALWGCASAPPAPPQQRVVLKTRISTRHYPVRGMTTAAIF